MKPLTALCVMAASTVMANENTPDRSEADATNQFTVRLVEALPDGNENRFLSAFSIRAALGMTSLGAAGETLSQMNAALGFSDGSTAAGFGRFGVQRLGALNESDSEVALANRLWVEREFSLLPAFLAACRDDFAAEAESANFSTDAEGERKSINAWISEQTREKIPELFLPGDINAATRVVLANAIYFKADWARPFPKDATENGDFRNAGGAVSSVPLMQISDKYLYAEDEQWQAVRLPYSDDVTAMEIFLPKQEDNLSLPAVWIVGGNPDAWTNETVDLTLPKFTLRERLELARVLGALGMTDAFDASAADFSRMDGSRDLSISAVIHEAFVEVDEEGTEAAAATGVVMRLTAMRPSEPKVFRADRPFWFVIRDMESGVVLFLGRVSDL